MGQQRRILSETDREEISRGIAENLEGKQLAARIGRCPSVVSREITRHGGRAGYRAVAARRAAAEQRRRPKIRKIDADPVLREKVIGKLRAGCSPDQVAGRLRREHGGGHAERVAARIYAIDTGEFWMQLGGRNGVNTAALTDMDCHISAADQGVRLLRNVLQSLAGGTLRGVHRPTLRHRRPHSHRTCPYSACERQSLSNLVKRRQEARWQPLLPKDRGQCKYGCRIRRQHRGIVLRPLTRPFGAPPFRSAQHQGPTRDFTASPLAPGSERKR